MSTQIPIDNTFKQVMDLWITPEVIRRQDAGQLPRPCDLSAAQIIFHADGRPNETRLNEEIRAICKVKLKEGVSKSDGDPIYTDEIDTYESFRLPDGEDPNCGHITLYRGGAKWTVAFDFIYNKRHATEHLDAARQFLRAAQEALANRAIRVFVDTCFSAAELAARALLLTTPLPGQKIKMSHDGIRNRYNLEAKYGNVDAAHKDALNRLAALLMTTSKADPTG